MFAAATALVSCGQNPLQLGNYAPYVQRFEDTSVSVGAPVQVSRLRIQEGTLDSGRIAACSFPDPDDPLIVIQKDAWNGLNETERQTAIFHELGHCILMRQHRDDRDAQGDPVSIMNSKAIPSDVYLRHEPALLQELFLQK